MTKRLTAAITVALLLVLAACSSSPKIQHNGAVVKATADLNYAECDPAWKNVYVQKENGWYSVTCNGICQGFAPSDTKILDAIAECQKIEDNCIISFVSGDLFEVKPDDSSRTGLRLYKNGQPTCMTKIVMPQTEAR